MPTNLSLSPSEGGVIHIRAVFKDENGTLVVPSQIGYTLTNANGVVLQSRQLVSSPAAQVVITISGSVLSRYNSSDDLRRALKIDYTYTSTYGVVTNQDEARFSIEDMWSV